MSTPQAVLDALNNLNESDRAVVEAYVRSLEAQLYSGSSNEDRGMGDNGGDEAQVDTEPMNNDIGEDEVPFPAIYESGEDYDKASELKQEAADLKSAGQLEEALEKYTAAVTCAPPSALLYANRALVLFELGRYRAAERDCSEALKENPDSAKALRVRGKVRKALGLWELALHDLSASQTIDFDEATVEDLKFLTEKHLEWEKQVAEKRIQDEEKKRKRSEEIKKAQEEARREAAEEQADASRQQPSMPRGMPGGGMPGGMEGMMASLMNDPELVAAMQKPKVQAALQELMGGPGGPMGLLANPAKLQELMSDPDVGPVLGKLIGKLTGGMGVPGGGMGAGQAGDGVPDVNDVDDLDDIPDLSNAN